MVKADHLTAEALLDSLERGDFYASTGVNIKELLLDEETLSIMIAENGMTKFRTQFIGKNGKVFKEDISNPASYRFMGNEMYIRVKIFDSNGRIAWTQPVMIKIRNKQ